ncbi:MAG: caspase family protein [Pleurocapsa sp.]
MGLDRRTFLQQAGLAWFTWGTAEAGISSLVNNERLTASIKNYQQNLTQPTKRKLALLVGINRYPYHDDLAGCLMDVELQRELLIHRFNFNPSDIITLSDRQATRENIETALVEHLVQQAKPDDVVLFHFSGYGGQIKIPLASDGEAIKETAAASADSFRLANSFVPVDGLASSKKTLFANSILQETLLVLAQSLSTSKCTFVFDTCFNTTPRSQHGSFKIRSIPNIADSPSSQELAFLAQLRENLATKGLKPSKRLLSLPGVVLSATGKNQIAVERQWAGWSAGLFTQALTQHLWHITPGSKVQVAIARTAETVEQFMGKQQQPTLNNPDKSAIAYYLATSGVPNAAGVVSMIAKNGNVEVKLLGLPANILDCYGVDSCLSLVSNSQNAAPQLQVKSQEGLIAKTQLLSPALELQVGEFAGESIRIFRRDLNLNLALDDDLERIERVDATSAIANIAAINSTVVAKEQNADCLLGKVALDPALKSAANLATETPVFSYALYTAGGNLIAKTTGVEEEAVKVAIDRLQPQFNHLLAAKWLELTNNEFSSRLKVNATVTTIVQKQATSWQRSALVSEKLPLSAKKTVFSASGSNADAISNVPLLAKGTEINLALGNTDNRQLYVVILGIDSDCNIYGLYTPKSATAEAEIKLEDIAIASGSELVIPAAGSSWKWKVPESVGINTLYVIFAVQPFEETLKAFATQQNFKLDQQQVLNVTNPINVIKSLMQDLHQASSVASELLTNDNVYALDVNSWASLNFVYEVTNA